MIHFLLLCFSSLFLISCNNAISFSLSQEAESSTGNQEEVTKNPSLNRASLNRQIAYLPLAKEQLIPPHQDLEMAPELKVTSPPPLPVDWVSPFSSAKKTKMTQQPSSALPNLRAISPIGPLPVVATAHNHADNKKKQPLRSSPPTPPSLIAKVTEIETTPVAPAISAQPTKTKEPESVFIPPPPLDIVFVIDTSMSMHKHLRNFKTAFASFLSYFSSFDWQLMITDADNEDTWFAFINRPAQKGEALPLEKNGRILELKYLNPLIPNYNSIFLSSISLHNWGDYSQEGLYREENIKPCELPPFCQGRMEQPVRSLHSALMKNPNFFREKADLAVVLISNSQEKVKKNRHSVTPEEVIQQFRQSHGPHKRFEAYGLVIQEEDPECLRESRAQQKWFKEVGVSKKIIALSQRTGGEVFSLCAPDYQELALSIKYSFENPPPTEEELRGGAL